MSKTPYHFRIETNHILRSIDFQELINKILNQRVKIGLEHSQYTLKILSQNNPNPSDLFTDKYRFDKEISVQSYFLSKTNSFAAGKRVSLLNMDEAFGVRDQRFFVNLAGLHSSLHFDWNPHQNLLFGVFGEKEVRLYSPSRSSELTGVSNFSLNSSMKPDFVFNLRPGEAVAIPAYWWHQVRAETESISYSIRIQTEQSQKEEDYLKKLYPSWRFLQVYGQFGHEGVGSLLEEVIRKPSLGVEAIEECYKSIIGESLDSNREMYLKWAKYFLEFYKS